LLPVVAGIAQGLGIEPLVLIVPVVIGASCAFMLPMATPPNAIVFASGHIKVSQMAKAGFWANIIASLLMLGVVKVLINFAKEVL
jgi:sodium-dependent dicarboxylate transporter 2/3/5